MTNRLKPAETYTHTHTHTCNLLLSPKQIGTICFAIFSILISAPLFATDIPSSASTADCKNNPLQTYSGTSNLQAGWQANTIALHWYNGDDELTVPAASQSCVYDEGLTPPTTIPTKTGYTFKGWRVKQADTSCFASQVCGLNGSAVNGLTYDDEDETAFGVYTHDEQYKINTDVYGLTAGGWAIKDTNGGVIKGVASCNNTQPTTALGSISQDMTDEQVNNTLWGSCSSDAIKPGNTFNATASGQGNDIYCWCKMVSYTLNNGSICNTASFPWLFATNAGNPSDCAVGCAMQCATLVLEYSIIRRALFGVSQ